MKGGNLSLSDYPLASSKPQVTGDISPGHHLPKEKEPSHRGDIRGLVLQAVQDVQWK